MGGRLVGRGRCKPDSRRTSTDARQAAPTRQGHERQHLVPHLSPRPLPFFFYRGEWLTHAWPAPQPPRPRRPRGWWCQRAHRLGRGLPPWSRWGRSCGHTGGRWSISAGCCRGRFGDVGSGGGEGGALQLRRRPTPVVVRPATASGDTIRPRAVSLGGGFSSLWCPCGGFHEDHHHQDHDTYTTFGPCIPRLNVSGPKTIAAGSVLSPPARRLVFDKARAFARGQRRLVASAHLCAPHGAGGGGSRRSLGGRAGWYLSIWRTAAGDSAKEKWRAAGRRWWVVEAAEAGATASGGVPPPNPNDPLGQLCVNWGEGNANASAQDQPRSVAAAQAFAPRRWHEVPMRETSSCTVQYHAPFGGAGGGGEARGCGKRGTRRPRLCGGCAAVAIPSESRLGTVALHAGLLRPPHDTVCVATTVRPDALGGNGTDRLLAVATSQVQSCTSHRPVAIPASPLRERGALPRQSRSRLSQV